MLKEKRIEPDQFIELLKKHPRGLTIEEISQTLPLNRNAASKYLNRMLVTGQVEMKTFGPAKVFFISRRLPIRDLFNLTSDMILVFDEDFKVRHVNNRFLEMVRITRDDLETQPIDRIRLSLPFSAGLRKNIRENGRSVEILIDEIIPVNGTRVHLAGRSIPIVFEAGESGVALILRDTSTLGITGSMAGTG